MHFSEPCPQCGRESVVVPVGGGTRRVCLRCGDLPVALREPPLLIRILKWHRKTKEGLGHDVM